VIEMPKELFKQLFKKPFTNLFPLKHAPKSVLALLKKVKEGKVKLNDPVPVPKGFRGAIVYDKKNVLAANSALRSARQKPLTI